MARVAKLPLLCKAIDGLGDCAVIALSDAADRGLDASLFQAFGIFDRDVLNAAITVMHEAAARNGSAIVQKRNEEPIVGSSVLISAWI